LAFFLKVHVLRFAMLGSITRTFLIAAASFLFASLLATLSTALAGVTVLPVFMSLLLLFYPELRADAFALTSALTGFYNRKYLK
jgi:hypothetical protein